MQSKKSKVNKIKKCLKNGVPVAAIAVGIMAAGCGCDNSSDNIDKPQPAQPTQPPEKTVDPNEVRPIVGTITATVEKIEFNDSDFTEDLSKLSAAGEKKLEDFMAYAEKKYTWIGEVKIDIADTDAQRKRKKAKAVFDKFSYVYHVLSGVAITPKRMLDDQIARDLNAEYKFIGNGRKW